VRTNELKLNQFGAHCYYIDFSLNLYAICIYQCSQ